MHEYCGVTLLPISTLFNFQTTGKWLMFNPLNMINACLVSMRVTSFILQVDE